MDAGWLHVEFGGLVHRGKFFDRDVRTSYQSTLYSGRLRCRPGGEHVVLDRKMVRGPESPITCLECLMQEGVGE